jgi:hypothetical protein
MAGPITARLAPNGFLQEMAGPVTARLAPTGFTVYCSNSSTVLNESLNSKTLQPVPLGKQNTMKSLVNAFPSKFQTLTAFFSNTQKWIYSVLEPNS